MTEYNDKENYWKNGNKIRSTETEKEKLYKLLILDNILYHMTHPRAFIVFIQLSSPKKRIEIRKCPCAETSNTVTVIN